MTFSTGSNPTCTALVGAGVPPPCVQEAWMFFAVRPAAGISSWRMPGIVAMFRPD